MSSRMAFSLAGWSDICLLVDLWGWKKGGGRYGETPRGDRLRTLAWGGMPPPPEENADLLGFIPERVHLLLQGVYGDFPYHNDRAHVDRGIAEDAAWKRRWRQISAQSVSWYATPSGAVGRRFTTILAVEWREVISHSWNS